MVVGVTGGIAAYKTLEVVSRLRKLGAEVRVIMTESATRLVAHNISNNIQQPCCRAYVRGT